MSSYIAHVRSNRDFKERIEKMGKGAVVVSFEVGPTITVNASRV
jgi:hypothetical protein